ncbi:hypothetical protein SSX86_008848 [Deinandra increscens subsp. villosa]|uniref:Calcineurin-like phosphoesterase domain-containing protein n=1 Tax=Deinandra increscens subsp. villosa TaxID=3103831 RepID=A0AAP0DJU4_9ASTR
MAETTTCKNLPNLLSSFVDTFVDYSVSGGIFLPPVPTPSPPFQTSFPPPHRLIAIGDLHGDLLKSKQSLRLAGLIDSDDRWSGGSSTLLQVGDVLDRGGQELQILYFLEKLKRQALKSGGNVITMNGNHEIMNVDGDFRLRVCVMDWKTLTLTPRDLYEGIPLTFPRVKQEYAAGFRSRIAALRPKGPIAARFLSQNLTVAVVGESVFVHGGMLPSHVAYGFERINREVRDWIKGTKKRVNSSLVRGRDSLVWLRIFSNEEIKDCDCATLEHVLSTIPGARRMIMGHTIQESGINGVCDNRALRIDVGMSRGCINGLPEVLEISEDSGIRILTSNPMSMDHQSADLLMPPAPPPVPKQVKVEA